MAATTRRFLRSVLLLLAGAAVLSVSAARGVPAEPRARAAADPVAGAEPSAYEMLERFGFPKGILPVGVTGYTLRPSDGAFEVFLGRDCEFEVDGGYRLTYQRTISGKVAGGSIRDLRGVAVRIFMVNWGIDRLVMADADHLMLYVGPLSQAFPADNFEESPVVPPQSESPLPRPHRPVGGLSRYGCAVRGFGQWETAMWPTTVCERNRCHFYPFTRGAISQQGLRR